MHLYFFLHSPDIHGLTLSFLHPTHVYYYPTIQRSLRTGTAPRARLGNSNSDRDLDNMAPNTIAAWEAAKRAAAIPNLDDFEDEMSEEQFEAMLEEDEDEDEEGHEANINQYRAAEAAILSLVDRSKVASREDIRHSPASETSDVGTNDFEMIDAPSLAASVSNVSVSDHEYDEDGSVLLPAPMKAVHRALGTYELLERILLDTPAHDVYMSAQLVSRYWRDLTHKSIAVDYHLAELYIATLTWPPKPTPECPKQLSLFRPVRQTFFVGKSLTMEQLASFRRKLLVACMLLMSAYHTANKANPSIPTLESDTAGKFVNCRVCQHLHEKFRWPALNPIIYNLQTVRGAQLCFTGFGPHLMLQIKVEDQDHYIENLIAYFHTLLHSHSDNCADTIHELDSTPMGKPLANRFTLSLEGDLEWLSTVSPPKPQKRITVGQILKLLANVVSRATSKQVYSLQARLSDLRNKLNTFLNPTLAYTTNNDPKYEDKLRKQISEAINELDMWVARHDKWKQILGQLMSTDDPKGKVKEKEKKRSDSYALKAMDSITPHGRLVNVHLYMSPKAKLQSGSRSGSG